MCGRYTLKTPAGALVEHFAVDPHAIGQLSLFGPRYNVAPTQAVPVIRLRAAEDGVPRRTLDWLRWGFVPSWSKQPPTGRPLINARSESVADKPSFRTAFRRRRCLVPADGFYEWRTEGRHKQPFYIRRPDGLPFAFAGIWEAWHGDDVDAPLESFAILTTRANRLMADLHDRMPVILAPNDYAAWLEPGEDEARQAELLQLCEPAPDDELVADPVSPRVNKPQYDDPQCIALQRDLFE
jgi:putative SOS response-associated peptidase YedK